MIPEARGLEFLIIAAIALIVVGPKELPNLLRKLGQFVGKLRNMANDFRSSFDEMARQSELDDLRKQVEEMRAQAESTMNQDSANLYGEPDPYEPVEASSVSVDAPAKPKRAPRKTAAAKSVESASPPAVKPARRRPAKSPT